MEIKKIVVAYDGSKGSQKALDWALYARGKFGSELITVTVVKPPEFSPMVSEIEEYFDDSKKFCEPMLQKVREYGARNGVTIKTEIILGHPAESIVKYAYDSKADLIVTGTRGTGGFKNLIIGSVAQKIISYSKVPVTIIKE